MPNGNRMVHVETRVRREDHALRGSAPRAVRMPVFDFGLTAAGTQPEDVGDRLRAMVFDVEAGRTATDRWLGDVLARRQVFVSLLAHAGGRAAGIRRLIGLDGVVAHARHEAMSSPYGRDDAQVPHASAPRLFRLPALILAPRLSAAVEATSPSH